MTGTSIERSFDILATRLKDARSEKGWTLDKLASVTGLSKPFLARMESGQRQPSLAVLISLAQAFDVSIASLIDEEATDESIVVNHRDTAERHGNGLTYEVLSPSKATASMQAMRVTVPAGRPGGEMYEHAGEEWLYVLSGTLRLTLGDAEIEISAGDAAQFDSATPHRLTALGDADAEVLLVASGAPKPGSPAAPQT